jgi:hypothetical protein
MSERPPEQPSVEPEVAASAATHPIQLIVSDDLKRSRLTVFFRLFLAIPHYLWLGLWQYAIVVVTFINWFVTLFAGRSPEDLHIFVARYLRYKTHLSAYTTLLANPYPSFFGREGTYPVDLEIAPVQTQGRWITLLRYILGIPAFILAYVFAIVTYIVALIAWFIALFIGRTPKGMRDLIAYCRRYRSQTSAYALLLTDRYPSLSGPTL